MSRLGEKIKESRNKSGISAKQFAKKLGVAENYILDIEAGRKIINDEMIRRVEKLLNITLGESIFDEIDEPVENIKETVAPKAVNSQWEDAFAHVLKKIPVCDIELKQINDYIYEPVIDKKVEGFNPEKLVYVEAPDDSMRGFRIYKGDKILVFKDIEMSNNSISLIEIDGKTCIRQLKRLDSAKVLILSHSNDLKTETREVKSFKVIGKCIKMEIYFG